MFYLSYYNCNAMYIVLRNKLKKIKSDTRL